MRFVHTHLLGDLFVICSFEHEAPRPRQANREAAEEPSGMSGHLGYRFSLAGLGLFTFQGSIGSISISTLSSSSLIFMALSSQKRASAMTAQLAGGPEHRRPKQSG